MIASSLSSNSSSSVDFGMALDSSSESEDERQQTTDHLFTNLENQVVAEACPLLHHLQQQTSMENEFDASPPLGFAPTTHMPAILPPVTSWADPFGTVFPPPRNDPSRSGGVVNHKSKKFKFMPPRSQWMSHQRIPDGKGGTMKPPPQMSTFWLLCCADPNLEDSAFHEKFRHRFRVSHASHLKLLQMVNDLDCFKKWHKKKSRRKSPMELLVLGALRHLGRGNTFDCLEENTFVS